MRRPFTPATLLCDFYKIGHRRQYPNKTQRVYSTWIPRTSRLTFANKVAAFAFQVFIKKYLIGYFNEFFFSRPLDEVIAEYVRVVKHCLGVANPETDHIEALHKLGYLPLLIKAVPEGTMVPVRVPMLTVENTHDDFGWLTNYIETLASCEMWQGSTSATIAVAYYKTLSKYAEETSDIIDFVKFQGHDFSFRGMGCLEAAILSGMGHLLPFVGSDTIPAILAFEDYYNANIEKELIGCSVNATEHSVMCAGGADNELETYRRLITEVYPTGIVSIVSDTWDLWNTLTEIMPSLKAEVMERDGKVVIRPDSGDPVDIICGTARPIKELKHDATGRAYPLPNGAEAVIYNEKYYKVVDPDGCHAEYVEVDPTPAMKGVVQLLFETFGGAVNTKKYIQLSDKIGTIYGDAITVARAEDMCKRLKEKGFASTNIVLGIGSYTYQYNTRDTFGFAMKATYCVIDGKEVNIFKDPATDAEKVKKSLTGRVAVLRDKKGDLFVMDGLTALEEQTISDHNENVLQPIFCDGKLLKDWTLSEVRALIHEEMKRAA